MHRKEILETALRYVTQDRNVENGEPAVNFQNIADYWNVHLDKRGLLLPFARITADDVGILFVLVKIARTLASVKPDDYIDMAGYAACAGGIALGDKGDTYPLANLNSKPPSSGGAAQEERPKYQVGDWVKTHEVEGFIVGVSEDNPILLVEVDKQHRPSVKSWASAKWLKDAYPTVRVGRPHYWVRESEVIEGPRRPTGDLA